VYTKALNRGGERRVKFGLDAHLFTVSRWRSSLRIAQLPLGDVSRKDQKGETPVLISRMMPVRGS
jgi:hypothetical protein